MTVRELIFTILTLAALLLVKNSSAKFNENQTNSVATDTD
jgi:hypothetical protein